MDTTLHVTFIVLLVHKTKNAPGSNTCVLVSVFVASVYLDHLHVLAPGQVDPEQRVLLFPGVTDHRDGSDSSLYEAAAVNLR